MIDTIHPDPAHSAVLVYEGESEYESSLFALLEYLASQQNDLANPEATKAAIRQLFEEPLASECSANKLTAMYDKLVLTDAILARLQYALRAFTNGNTIECFKQCLEAVSPALVAQKASGRTPVIGPDEQLPIIESTLKYFKAKENLVRVNQLLIFLKAHFSEQLFEALLGKLPNLHSASWSICNLATILDLATTTEDQEFATTVEVKQTDTLVAAIEYSEGQLPMALDFSSSIQSYMSQNPVMEYDDFSQYFSRFTQRDNYLETFMHFSGSEKEYNPNLFQVLFNMIIQKRAHEFLAINFEENLTQVQTTELFLSYMQGNFFNRIENEEVKKRFSEILRQLKYSILLGETKPLELVYQLASKEICLDDTFMLKYKPTDGAIPTNIPDTLQQYLFFSEQQNLTGNDDYELLHAYIKRDYDQLCAIDRELTQLTSQRTNLRQEFERIPGANEEQDSAFQKFQIHIDAVAIQREQIIKAKNELRQSLSNLRSVKKPDWSLLRHAFGIRKYYVPELSEIKINAEAADENFKKAKKQVFIHKHPILHSISETLVNFARRISKLFTSNRIAPRATVDTTESFNSASDREIVHSHGLRKSPEQPKAPSDNLT